MFSKQELAILKSLQEGIPLCARPFAAVAEEAGCSEARVLSLLQRLQQEGVIRRFGALLNHRLAGFERNALLAWDLREKEAGLQLELGRLVSEFESVSHCYLRSPVIPSLTPQVMAEAGVQDDNHETHIPGGAAGGAPLGESTGRLCPLAGKAVPLPEAEDRKGNDTKGDEEGVFWPYQLYAMLHAPDEAALALRINEIQKVLQAAAGKDLKKPLVLRTLHEYKKTAMLYFR